MSKVIYTSFDREETLAMLERFDEQTDAGRSGDHATGLDEGYSTSTGSSSRPASRSRPRCTAARNFWRLTSRVERISSA